MYPIKGGIHKVVILRPGALGDVLAVRGTIRLIKELFPEAEISLAAPGERGRLFQRPEWADHVHDWERAAFSWLFSDSGESPPPSLQAVFSRADWILSYAEPRDGDGAVFEARLDQLAPAAAKVFCPSRPHAGEHVPIGEWLASAALGFCRAYDLVAADSLPDLRALAASRMEVADLPPCAKSNGDYAVIHPGSGSAAKNWRLDNYSELGRQILESGMASHISVTSGEADGDLGGRLAGSLPGAEHIHSPRLETLAHILAHAKLFVGNDSGVSHLAAAVQTRDGRFPHVVAVFGPSDPGVWAPPGALVLPAGVNMDELDANEAYEAIRAMLHVSKALY